jgi:hypothetical protein
LDTAEIVEMRTWNRGLEAKYIRKKRRIYHRGTETQGKSQKSVAIRENRRVFSGIRAAVVMYFDKGI